MEKVSESVADAFGAALPEDPRVERKKMFGMPCAFVNRQMFFGTFESTVVARVGPERAKALVGTNNMRLFAPMEGREWADYVQLEVGAAGAAPAGSSPGFAGRCEGFHVRNTPDTRLSRQMRRFPRPQRPGYPTIRTDAKGPALFRRPNSETQPVRPIGSDLRTQSSTFGHRRCGCGRGCAKSAPGYYEARYEPFGLRK